MPTYTLELYRVIDLKPDNMPEDEWLGLNEYPLFNPEYRQGLNKKIKDHYMFQEIGHETIEQFRFRMRARMNEIMPAYNQLYETTLKPFDPLVTVDILNTSKGSQEQTSSGTSENSTLSDIDAKSKNVMSNFPQVALAGNADYATSGGDANSQTKTTAKVSDATAAENASSSSAESRTKGYQGSPAQLIQAARATIINVDMMIIADLDPLFMAVWNNADEYSATNGRYIE